MGKKLRDYNQGPPRNSYSEEDVVMIFEQLRTLEQEPSVQSR